MEGVPVVDLDISIVSFNSKRHLPDFFASLRDQDYPLSRISLLIVDHGSHDSSWDLIQDFSSAFSGEFRAVRIRQDQNGGFGEGHNRNLRFATSDFVLVSNVDLTFHPRAIVNVVCCALNAPADVASWELRQLPFEHPKYYHPVHKTTEWSSHAAVLLRIACFRKVGGYEPRFFMYGEDVDLSFRLRSVGYELWFCHDAAVFHCRDGDSGYRLSSFVGMLRANFWIRVRHGRWSDVVRFIGVYTASLKWCPKTRGWLWQLLRLNLQWWQHLRYFVKTRQASGVRPCFRAMDYGIHRWEGSGELIRRPVGAPLVSIIIRTYGNRGWIAAEAVKSAFAQDYRPIELVVVEDGSNCFRKDLEKMDSRGCQVSYYSIAKKGRSYAGNYGLQKAQGDLIGFLDDDDLLFPDHAEVLVQDLVINTDYGAAYSVAFEMATDIQQDRQGYVEHGLRVAYRQEFSSALLQKQNYLPIQTVLFRRQLFDKYGGFREDLDQLEDWNLWARFAWVSQFKFVDRVTSLYRVPHRERDRLERQKKLDDAFNLVRQINADFQRENTPP